ncbi:MAG: type 1 glutamine amidotransferase [Pseudomonadota bacterium]
MKILIIQNEPLSPSGIVGERIAARDADADIRLPHQGDALPGTADGYAGCVVLGGPQHAMDDARWPALADVVETIREFHREGRPLLGICLGSQLMARAFGAPVRRHTHLEIGFHELAVTPAGEKDSLLSGLGPQTHILQWHEDTFDLPEGAEHLMAGEGCRNQAFRLGERAYAFQCHFEATPAIVENWFGLCEESLGKHIGRERVPAEIERLRAQWPQHGAAARRFAETVTDRWLDLA